MTTTHGRTTTLRADVFTDHLLTSGLDGRLVTPRDDGWDAARTPWQLAYDQRPEAVVRAASVADVAATVRAAAAAGLRVAPQGTGHNAGPLGDLSGTVLLRTTDLREITIDPGRRVARVGAGVAWGELTAAAAEHGLAGLAGSSRDVGVVGYTLNGGMSFLARAHGLASDHLLAAEVVTADGRLRRVDAEHDPELFWALRGGNGAGAAIVTALELRLFPITQVYAGALFFPIERAADVLGAWRELLGGLPGEITSTARLFRFPALPELPEPLRGRSFAVAQFVSLLEPAATDDLLAPVRALDPALDTMRPMGPVELGELNMDPPAPVPATVGGGDALRLTAGTLDALVAVAGADSEVTLLAVELRHLGGAVAPSGRDDRGALDGLPGDLTWFGVAMTPDAASVADAHAQLDRVAAALAPWSADRAYANFAESARPASAFFDPATLPRLRAVKAGYDPADLVRAHHPVTRGQEER